MRAVKERAGDGGVAPGAPAGGGAVDDRTPIDDLEARRGRKAKEELPEGFTRRLPAGPKRQVRIVRAQLGKKNGKVFRVTEPDGSERDYDKVEIEGPSRLTHEVEQQGCSTVGRAAVETEASVLVGRGRKAGG